MGTCLGLLSAVCVFVEIHAGSVGSVINVPVRDQPAAGHVSIITNLSYINKNLTFQQKKGVFMFYVLLRPRLYRTLCAIQLKPYRKTFSCISY